MNNAKGQDAKIFDRINKIKASAVARLWRDGWMEEF